MDSDGQWKLSSQWKVSIGTVIAQSHSQFITDPFRFCLAHEMGTS